MDKMDELLQYRDRLEERDKEVFDKLISYAKGNTESLTSLESMLLAMVIEQQKKIAQLRVHG